MDVVCSPLPQPILPGSFAYACLDPLKKISISHHWFVVVSPEDSHPLKPRHLDGKSSGHYPCWIIDKQDFTWIHRRNLFSLDRSQPIARQRTADYDEFAALYTKINIMIRWADARTGPEEIVLGYFQDQMVMDAQHIRQRQEQAGRRLADRSRAFDDFSAARRDQIRQVASENETNYPMDEDRQFRPVNDRTDDENEAVLADDKTHLRHTTRSSSSSRSSRNPITPTSTESPIPIKTEGEMTQIAYEQGIDEADRIKIYVGTHNHEVQASKKDLEKSSILCGLIRNDKQSGSFIMHPKLQQVRLDDMYALLQYIRSSDYSPTISEDIPNGATTKTLNGLLTSDEYSRELVRSGRLYVLAQRFQVVGMPDKIFEKITEAQFQPYNSLSVIGLGRTIFTSDRGTFSAGASTESDPNEGSVGTPAATTSNSDATALTDPLEEWIVDALAHRLKEIMRKDEEREAFWALEKVTAHRRLVAHVFEKCAANYRQQGVFPSDIIELD